MTVFTRLAQRGQRRTEGGCQARITLHACGGRKWLGLQSFMHTDHDVMIAQAFLRNLPYPPAMGPPPLARTAARCEIANRAATPKLVVTQFLRVVRKSGVPAVVSSKVDENSFTRTYFFL